MDPNQMNMNNMNMMNMNNMNMNPMNMNNNMNPMCMNGIGMNNNMNNMNQMGMNNMNQMGMNNIQMSFNPMMQMNNINNPMMANAMNVMNQMPMQEMANNQINVLNNQVSQFQNQNQGLNQQQGILTLKFFRTDDLQNFISIQCTVDDKVSDVIEKYWNKAGYKDPTAKFIFNTKNLVPELSVAEAGLINNANIQVVSTKGIKGA